MTEYTQMFADLQRDEILLETVSHEIDDAQRMLDELRVIDNAQVLKELAQIKNGMKSLMNEVMRVAKQNDSIIKNLDVITSQTAKKGLFA